MGLKPNKNPCGPKALPLAVAKHAPPQGPLPPVYLPLPPSGAVIFFFACWGGGLGFGGFMILALSLVFWGLLALFFLFFGLF